jgi:hypothetical protein
MALTAVALTGVRMSLEPTEPGSGACFEANVPGYYKVHGNCLGCVGTYFCWIRGRNHHLRLADCLRRQACKPQAASWVGVPDCLSVRGLDSPADCRSDCAAARICQGHVSRASHLVRNWLKERPIAVGALSGAVGGVLVHAVDLIGNEHGHHPWWGWAPLNGCFCRCVRGASSLAALSLVGR